MKCLSSENGFAGLFFALFNETITCSIRVNAWYVLTRSQSLPNRIQRSIYSYSKSVVQFGISLKYLILYKRSTARRGTHITIIKSKKMLSHLCPVKYLYIPIDLIFDPRSWYSIIYYPTYTLFPKAVTCNASCVVGIQYC